MDSLSPFLLLEIEHMEWFLKEDSDGLIVPTYREAYEDEDMEDVLFPTQYQHDWCQLGAAESETTTSPHKYCGAFVTPSAKNPDRQDMFGQIRKEAPLCEDRVPSWETSSHDQPVFDLENGAERMDDIFSDSFLEEDQLCPDSLYASLSFEDLVSDMLADDSSRRESEPCVDACSFPMSVDDVSENWNKEDDSPSCLTPDESERFLSYTSANDLTVSDPRITSATDDSEAATNLDEVKCSEAIVLLELEGVLLRMNEKTRICFRDAMYRLAKSFEQKCSIYQIGSKIVTHGNCEISRMESSRSAETATNVIDRTIANLMFSEQHCGLPELRIP